MSRFKGRVTVALATFLTVEICLLALWIVRLDGNLDNEDFILFQTMIAAVGFPSTILPLVVLACADIVIPIYTGFTTAAAVAIWLSLTIATYFQWFVWFPKLYRLVRRRWRTDIG
jgi:hypothetical protein